MIKTSRLATVLYSTSIQYWEVTTVWICIQVIRIERKNLAVHIKQSNAYAYKKVSA